MQRSLKPQSTGQHRGDPPAFARAQRERGCRAEARSAQTGSTCNDASFGSASHFADVAQQRQQQFRKLPGAFAPRECESLRRPQFDGEGPPTEEVIGSDTYRHNQKRYAMPKQLSLQREYREVMQQPAKP